MTSKAIISIFLFLGFFSCDNRDYSPKPRAFHRIKFPAKNYVQIPSDGCPFIFEIPEYSKLVDDTNTNAKPCWKNLDFPDFNARLHLSYFEINNNATLDALTEDARSFVFKHTTKATAIDQQQISNAVSNLYGLVYNIQGNTASNFQFYISDNKKHYLRGALYFNEKPHLDSIQPVLDFVKSDIQYMISTIRWK